MEPQPSRSDPNQCATYDCFNEAAADSEFCVWCQWPQPAEDRSLARAEQSKNGSDREPCKMGFHHFVIQGTYCLNCLFTAEQLWELQCAPKQK